MTTCVILIIEIPNPSRGQLFKFSTLGSLDRRSEMCYVTFARVLTWLFNDTDIGGESARAQSNSLKCSELQPVLRWLTNILKPLQWK
jgi:hypothetical protein